jgi:hypothetical protein
MTQPNDAAVNPLPFNPATMSVSKALDAAESLKTLFDLALREAMSDAELGAHVRTQLAHWQNHKR